jgi:hypothetical protein
MAVAAIIESGLLIAAAIAIVLLYKKYNYEKTLAIAENHMADEALKHWREYQDRVEAKYGTKCVDNCKGCENAPACAREGVSLAKLEE